MADEVKSGAQLARDFQLTHESKMTRMNRPQAASDILRDRLFVESWVKAYKQGIVKATVLNMHTFPLNVNLGYLGYMTVPARKSGEPFYKFVIDTPKMDARDLGDARFMPEVVAPIELAEEFAREYNETGGVIAYTGDGDPDSEVFKAALERQSAWYWKEYGIGRDIWASRRRHDLISERQRDAARALTERGLIEKPEWLDKRSEKMDSANLACEACGTDLKKNAKWCTFCKFVLDVKWVLDHKAQVPRDIYETALAAQEEAPVVVAAGPTKSPTGLNIPKA